MQLLSPSGIQDMKRDEEEKTRIRVSGLAAEESEIVHRINLLREEEKEIARIQKEKMDKESVGVSAIEAKKIIIETEVKNLEARKQEALRPVNEKMQEAEGIMKKAEDYASTLIPREAKIVKEENKISALVVDLEKKEKELDIKEEGVQLEKRQVEAQRDEVRKSMDALSLKWVEYDTAFTSRENSLTYRENKIATDSITNENERKVLEQRKIEQDKKDRELADKYATLERTLERLNIKI